MFSEEQLNEAREGIKQIKKLAQETGVPEIVAAEVLGLIERKEALSFTESLTPFVDFLGDIMERQEAPGEKVGTEMGQDTPPPPEETADLSGGKPAKKVKGK